MCVCVSVLKVSTHTHTDTHTVIESELYLDCITLHHYEIECCIFSITELSYIQNRIAIIINVILCCIWKRISLCEALIHVTAAALLSFITQHFYGHFNYCNQTVIETDLVLHPLTFEMLVSVGKLCTF